MENSQLKQLTIEQLNNLIVQCRNEIKSRKIEKCLVKCVDIKKFTESKHYNGGWFKTVTGIDKSKTNGYSIQGEFFGFGGDMKKNPAGSEMLKIGSLILECSIEGSRKNQSREYKLVKILNDSFELLIEEEGSDWATDLWEIIEQNL